jgi:hypothetical protein
VIRRIAAITSALLAAGALTAWSATAAGAATSHRILAGSAAHLTASTDASCAGVWFENSYGSGNGQFLYARTGSPHQLLANTAKTVDCAGPGTTGSNVALIEQDGTDLCFNVESSAAGAQVDETTCGNMSTKSQVVHLIWNNNYSGSFAETELQFINDGKDCIYQDGRDSPVHVEACNPNNTGDEWITDW